MEKLSTEKVEALCRWAIENHSKNWGCWSEYPIGGATYLQFGNNPIVIKFDQMVEFNGEKFKRIGWGRSIPGKEKAITFSSLISDLKKAGIDFGTYPEKRVTKEVDGKIYNLLIRQHPYANYPLPDVCLLNDSGNIIRSGISELSKYYPEI